jgi:hypothetical protein
VANLHGPTLSEVVTIVVPQREQLQARVDDALANWVDLVLLTSPRTAWTKLSRTQVSVRFANGQGLCRMVGLLSHRPQDAHLRVVGYGAGETLRFTHRGQVQLLQRPALVSAATTARIVVLRCGAPDHVAVEACCVSVGGGGLRISGLPFASVGQCFEFDLFLVEREPSITGQFRVERVGPDGVLDAGLSLISAHDRGRLVHWAADHRSARVA